jgi:hypothetical protein
LGDSRCSNAANRLLNCKRTAYLLSMSRRHTSSR